jgi:Uncharacterized conserved domain (SAYSvFN)
MVRSASDRSASFYIGLVAWAIISIGLVMVELGVLAFFGTVVLGLWQYGLRDKFDGETTASAYSVFNKGGKSLPGSTTMQDVDQQLRSGGGLLSAGRDTDAAPSVSGPAEIINNDNNRFTRTSTTSHDERDRRRKMAADAALKRKTN